MLPIERLSIDVARRLRGLLFDLDDTLLDGTRLGEAAYSSLWRLREAGLVLVGVTGRPSGWAEVIARQWPVEGVVAENGPIAATTRRGRLELADVAGDERPVRRPRLHAIVGEIRA